MTETWNIIRGERQGPPGPVSENERNGFIQAQRDISAEGKGGMAYVRYATIIVDIVDRHAKLIAAAQDVCRMAKRSDYLDGAVSELADALEALGK